MTREEEIRARLENATGAPWTWDALEDSDWPARLNANASSSGYVLEACTPSDDNPYDLPAIDITNGDADFIANAPSDIDYLLKENQRLRTMTIEKLLIDSRGANMSVSGASGKEFMAMLIKVFEDSGGKNYLTMTFEKGKHKFEVTVRNLNGESSPAEKISELEAENQRLQDANNAMAAYLQSLANPDAWNGRTYIRGFRDPWMYADDALRYAGVEEREPRKSSDGAE